MLNKINPSKTVQNSTPMKTNASRAEELPPVIDPTGDQPPTATHAPEFTLGKLSLSGDNRATDTVHTLSANPENKYPENHTRLVPVITSNTMKHSKSEH